METGSPTVKSKQQILILWVLSDVPTKFKNSSYDVLQNSNTRKSYKISQRSTESDSWNIIKISSG